MLEDVVSQIEVETHETYDKEVPSNFIGELVMNKLKTLDQVAYVRFASVYREFKDVSEFLEELKPMLERKTEKARDGDAGPAGAARPRPLES